MKINFNICTVAKEKENVFNAKKITDFLNQQNIYYTMPEKSIEEEYDEDKYKSKLSEIERSWLGNEQIFMEKLQDFFTADSNMVIDVYLTNYGAMGFYNEQQKKVFINQNYPEDFNRLIKHEIIHLFVEPFIKKYQLKHEDKEELVNVLVKLFN